MGKVYPLIIYSLVVFCGGCTITEVFEGTATTLGAFLMVTGLAMVVYVVRLIDREDADGSGDVPLKS